MITLQWHEIISLAVKQSGKWGADTFICAVTTDECVAQNWETLHHTTSANHTTQQSLCWSKRVLLHFSARRKFLLWECRNTLTLDFPCVEYTYRQHGAADT